MFHFATQSAEGISQWISNNAQLDNGQFFYDLVIPLTVMGSIYFFFSVNGRNIPPNNIRNFRVGDKGVCEIDINTLRRQEQKQALDSNYFYLLTLQTLYWGWGSELAKLTISQRSQLSTHCFPFNWRHEQINRFSAYISAQLLHLTPQLIIKKCI